MPGLNDSYDMAAKGANTSTSKDRSFQYLAQVAREAVSPYSNSDYATESEPSENTRLSAIDSDLDSVSLLSSARQAEQSNKSSNKRSNLTKEAETGSATNTCNEQGSSSKRRRPWRAEDDDLLSKLIVQGLEARKVQKLMPDRHINLIRRKMKAKAPQKSPATPTKARKRPKLVADRWTIDMDEKILRRYHEFVDDKVIAKEVDISVSAVKNRLRHLQFGDDRQSPSQVYLRISREYMLHGPPNNA